MFSTYFANYWVLEVNGTVPLVYEQRTLQKTKIFVDSLVRKQDLLFLSFPKYGNPFITYLMLTSDTSQIFISNLSDLFGIYYENLQLVLVGKIKHVHQVCNNVLDVNNSR